MASLTPYLRERAVIVRDRFEVAEAAEIEIGMEAGDELLGRLDQRDLDRAGGILRDIFRDGGAARAAADHDDFGLCLARWPGRASVLAAASAPAPPMNCLRLVMMSWENPP